jgi:hypothetical protein
MHDTNILLAIVSFIGTIFLGAGSFFLKEFTQSVKALRLTVEELRIMLSVERERVSNLKDNITNNIVIIDEKVNATIDIVNDHTREIAILKTKDETYHKNKR